MTAPDDDIPSGDESSGRRMTVWMTHETILLIDGMSALLGGKRPGSTIHQAISLMVGSSHIKTLAATLFPGTSTMEAIKQAGEELRGRRKKKED